MADGLTERDEHGIAAEGSRASCQLNMPLMAHFFDFIKENAPHAKDRMLKFGDRQGQSVAICGAGPTLNNHLREIDKWGCDEVWAANSALPYLMDRKIRVTHGITVDQGDEMLRPREWLRTFPVRYYLASSVHPKLVRHLRKRHRQLQFFHNFLGAPDPEDWKGEGRYEMHLYTHLYQDSIQVGHGLNTVPRAVCLALALGFAEIRVYGADCACAVGAPPMPRRHTPEYEEWLKHLVAYADGSTVWDGFGETPMAEGQAGGQIWHTRVDMVISAKHLVDLVAEGNGRVKLIGDTLSNAIIAEGPGFFDKLPRLEEPGIVSNFGAAA